uniref:Uncharacterized protein n=1 Tax=Populus trichocarpa TaxID=3694 RepID=A9P873_POPTR|nr:unknown [Populus trichocarpa]
MDISSHPSNHSHFTKHGGYCGWCVLCHKQWIPVMGSSLWQALLCYLGHCPFVSFPQGFVGSAKSYANNCHRLVYSPCLHFLLAMGAHRPLHLRLHKSCRKWPMWNQLLDCLGIFLSCHLLSEPTLMYITRNQGTK